MKANLLTQIILGLSSNRPFFYSEADFQHCLAKALMEYGPVYLEYPLDGIHIDIILEEDGWYYPIELKYKTSTLECADLFNNTTRLKNHGAADLARYDFWKDVFRIDNSAMNVPSRAFSNVPSVTDSNVPLQMWLL